MQKNIVKFGFLVRLFQDLKLLLPLIRDYWKGTYRDVSLKSIIVFIVALAYIISPIDLIPDYIPVIGLLDDFAILSAIINSLQDELADYRKFKDEDAS